MIENIISRIEVTFDHNGDPLECEFYFLGSDEAFVPSEFTAGSPTRKMLDRIEELVLYGDTTHG